MTDNNEFREFPDMVHTGPLAGESIDTDKFDRFFRILGIAVLIAACVALGAWLAH